MPIELKICAKSKPASQRNTDISKGRSLQLLQGIVKINCLYQPLHFPAQKRMRSLEK